MCTHVYHVVFIHSLICALNYDCFHLLAIGENAVIKHRCASIQESVFSSFGHIPRSEFASIFNILRNLILFPVVALAFYIPTSHAQGFQTPHILTNTCYFGSFSYSGSQGVSCELITPLDFKFVFFSNNSIEHSFICCLAVCEFPLEKYILSPLTIFKLSFLALLFLL